MTSRGDTTPWIKVRERPFGFLCERCGSKDTPQLPASPTELVRRTKEFVKTHSRCRDKEVVR